MDIDSNNEISLKRTPFDVAKNANIATTNLIPKKSKKKYEKHMKNSRCDLNFEYFDDRRKIFVTNTLVNVD